MSEDCTSVGHSLGSLKKSRGVGRSVSFNLNVSDTPTLVNGHLFYVFFSVTPLTNSHHFYLGFGITSFFCLLSIALIPYFFWEYHFWFPPFDVITSLVSL
jgi:hypothetical protein